MILLSSHVLINLKNLILPFNIKPFKIKLSIAQTIFIGSILTSLAVSHRVLAENNAVQTTAKYTQTITNLLADIQSAENRLNKKQITLAKDQTVLSNKIFKRQQALIKLREKATLNRRLADENTLSLDKLKTRLNEWQQQQQYQLNLLNRFVRQYGNEKVLANAQVDKQSELLAQVISLISEQSNNLYPSMEAQSIVLANGELTQGHTLQVGPVTWFTVDNSNTVGLLDLKTEANVAKVALIQSDSEDHPLNSAVEQLKNTNTNKKVLIDLTFDPSLNRMITSQSQQENALEHLQKGGLWAIPIIAFACFALIIALLKAVQLTRLAKVKLYSQAQLASLFILNKDTRNKVAEFKGMQQVLFQLSLDNNKGDSRDDQLFNQLSYNKHSLDNWVGAIAVTAAVAPLLGLLGTVSGMIETFKMMTLFGSGDPEVVSGGIAQALITTELGLVVAIPALVLNALLSRKVKYYYNQLEAFAVQLSQLGSPSDIKSDTRLYKLTGNPLEKPSEENYV